MKYKLAIFDMDGTILNTLEDLADSLNYVLKKEGYPTLTYDYVRSIVGNGIHREIELSLPEGTSEDVIEKVFNEYVPYYADNCAIKTCPYGGIVDVIKELRNMGYKTAVVSNKKDVAVKELVEIYFKDCFDAYIGETDDIKMKPAPDMVNKVLDSIGCSLKDSVYIGDSEVDIATAFNSNIDLIAVSWGFRDFDVLKEKGAKIIVKSPNELLEFLK